MKWRIWDFDGTTLRIIGDPTGALALKGAAGYNNGVWVINKICSECYSNKKLGATATSLKRIDIQKICSYDYTQYKRKLSDWHEVTDEGSESSENLIHFGETKTYTSENNNKYPKLWGDNDQNWEYEYSNGTKTDKECIKWESIGNDGGETDNNMQSMNQKLIAKQSYYAHAYKEEEFPNNEYYNLIFKKADGQSKAGVYWLGGRCTYLGETRCDFDIQVVDSNSVGDYVTGTTMCASDLSPNCRAWMIRPIVSINLKSSKCAITPEYRRR